MSWLSRLAERQIQKAKLKGDLQGLAGEGKPLPERPGDAFVSAGDAVGVIGQSAHPVDDVAGRAFEATLRVDHLAHPSEPSQRLPTFENHRAARFLLAQ